MKIANVIEEKLNYGQMNAVGGRHVLSDPCVESEMDVMQGSRMVRRNLVKRIAGIAGIAGRAVPDACPA